MEKTSGEEVFYCHPFYVVIVFLLLPISECGRAPAMFIFGDSLIDNGNNNFIPTIARANYFPYGIDYGFPTGRFCNGLTVIDYGAKLLGLPFPVPYLSLESKSLEILKGVNYASAAAGILDATGQHYGARITLNRQIDLFEKTMNLQLRFLIPDMKNLSDYIESSMFIINIGSNDYINNYLLPDLYSSSRDYTEDAFADLLITNFERQLKSLYMLGARKIILVGIGPLGCIPSQLFLHNSSDGGCIAAVNTQVSLFNSRIQPLMKKLSSALPGLFFVYEDIYVTFLDMVENPNSYGFEENNKACCGSGRYGGQLSCLPFQAPCSKRERFIFWDSFHPTQAANKIIAEHCYGPYATDCKPLSGYALALL